MLKYLKILIVFALFISSSLLITPKNSAEAAGFGQWVNIDKSWKFRIDKPSQSGNADEMQYHIHVEGKGVKSAEGVNGDRSHKTTMKKDGVPKWVQKEIKSSSEYKKGKKAQDKIDAAKDKAQKINWLNPVQVSKVTITIVAVTGLAIFSSVSKLKSFVFS